MLYKTIFLVYCMFHVHFLFLVDLLGSGAATYSVEEISFI